MYSTSDSLKFVNDCKNTQIKEQDRIEPRSSTDHETSSIRHCLLHQSSSRNRCCNLSAACINGIYHAVGNIFHGGAVIGAALLTAADLTDRQKDGVGALTIGLIVAGTFCFWQLSCCPHQNAQSRSDRSYSGIPIASLNSHQSDTDPGTDTDSEVD